MKGIWTNNQNYWFILFAVNFGWGFLNTTWEIWYQVIESGSIVSAVFSVIFWLFLAFWGGVWSGLIGGFIWGVILFIPYKVIQKIVRK